MCNAVSALINLLHCKVQFLDIAGHPAFLITSDDETSRRPTPWVFFAPTFLGMLPDITHRWMFSQFLKKGIAIAGVDVGESCGSPKGQSVYTALYETLRVEHSLSERACLLAQSRGGPMLYNWAADNSRRVACIAGIYPVCDLRNFPGLEIACAAYGMSEAKLTMSLPEHNPVDRLAPLAKYRVPILHVHGDSDTVVPLEQNSGELLRRYRHLGGKMKLLIVPGKGHEVIPEFFQCQEFVDFVIRHI